MLLYYMKKFKNQQKFIDKAITKHQGKYSYTKTNYESSKTDVIITCPEHGDFEQKPYIHLNGSGCSQCGKNSYKKKMKLTNEEIIRRAKENNTRNHFDFSRLIIKENLAEIYCHRHGPITMPSANLMRGHGCRRCGNNQITYKEFVEKANNIHNNQYQYDENYWTGVMGDELPITCKKHGIFYMSANRHTSSSMQQGCPRCKRKVSIAETKWLNSINNDNIIRQYSLPGIGSVDGFDPITNTVYEYHGKFWHGSKEMLIDDIHPLLGISWKDLYHKSLDKNNKIINNGYKLVCRWE